ncbi:MULTISPECIES: contact-dependent growth inhibition system immunity protein [unclassified Isoptericola]|uniref:contact-dependent growth inhibition system immunity protein n=1 Tax=unclassified Isoptericola TaxID=2623355 RepID=UPI0036617F23
MARTYFHQDYDVEAPTPLGVVEVFRSDEAAATVQELRSDIEAALSANSDEDALEDLWLRQCGSMYDPTVDGVSFRDWFTSMLSVLR